jgi:hypothetical protein
MSLSNSTVSRTRNTSPPDRSFFFPENSSRDISKCIGLTLAVLYIIIAIKMDMEGGEDENSADDLG